MKKFEVYAHRGGFPPNCLSSFCFAGSIEADGIEADVCLTSDGEPIIYHAGTLKPPEPSSITWRQTKMLGHHILHFDELLAVLSVYSKLKCLLDIKVDSKKLIGKIVAKIGTSEFRQRIFLTAPNKKSRIANFSVDVSILEYAKSLDSDLKTHIIDILPLNMAETVKKYGADMVSFGWLDESLVSRIMFDLIFKTGLRNASHEIQKAQNEGAKTMAGIANTIKDIKYLMAICPSVDAIMTDNLEMALSVREKMVCH